MQDKRPAGRPRENMSAKRIGKRVAALRKRGLSFGEIGKRLGVTRQYVFQVHHRVIAEQSL